MKRKRGVGLVALLAAAGYSWFASGTTPFTWGADLATAGGFAGLFAVLVWRQVHPRDAVRPHPAARSYAAWIVILGILVIWELVTLLLGNRASFPTLSSLYDSASHFRAFKAGAFLAWLLLGWGLFAP